LIDELGITGGNILVAAATIVSLVVAHFKSQKAAEKAAEKTLEAAAAEFLVLKTIVETESKSQTKEFESFKENINKTTDTIQQDVRTINQSLLGVGELKGKVDSLMSLFQNQQLELRRIDKLEAEQKNLSDRIQKVELLKVELDSSRHAANNAAQQAVAATGELIRVMNELGKKNAAVMTAGA